MFACIQSSNKWNTLNCEYQLAEINHVFGHLKYMKNYLTSVGAISNSGRLFCRIIKDGLKNRPERFRNELWLSSSYFSELYNSRRSKHNHHTLSFQLFFSINRRFSIRWQINRASGICLYIEVGSRWWRKG